MRPHPLPGAARPPRRFRTGWLLAAAVLALSACAPAQPPTGPADWRAYRSFLVPASPLPLRARGSVLLNYRGNRETGNLEVAGSEDLAFRLEISAKLLGSSALEIRFDPRQVLVLDYGKEAYFLGPNRPRTREKLLALDIAPAEFVTVLTARVPERAFEAGGGHRPAPDQAAYRQGDTYYWFRLGDDGLPREWFKYHGDAPRFRVEYRDYMEVAAPGGGTLRLPRKIRVYVSQGPPRLVLGFSEMRPWADGLAPIRVAEKPPPGWRFQPLEDGLGGRGGASRSAAPLAVR